MSLELDDKFETVLDGLLPAYPAWQTRLLHWIIEMISRAEGDKDVVENKDLSVRV